MNFDEAQEIVKKAYLPWVLDEETFQPLGKYQAVVKASLQDMTFLALIEGRFSPDNLFKFFLLEEDTLSDLTKWYLKQDSKLKDTLNWAETGLKLALDVLPMQGMARENAAVALTEVQKRLEEMEDASEL